MSQRKGCGLAGFDQLKPDEVESLPESGHIEPVHQSRFAFEIRHHHFNQVSD
jgi:hypothetical protein